MARALLNGSQISVDALSDERIEAAALRAMELDNHAAQNASGETYRAWFASYCDVHEKLFGRLVTL